MELAGGMDESALARRILDASLALIDEGGLASLSMREVARRAGVSHQAPYHHFADRESILAAIAREGFELLDAELTAALAAAPSLRERMVAMGRGYVRFAVAHPARFRVMFRPDLVDLQRFPDALCSGDLAFRHVKKVVHELLGTTPEAPTPEDDVWASILWSSGHGLACLILDGPLAMKIASSQARDAHIDSVFETMTDMLIARASRAPDKPARAPAKAKRRAKTSNDAGRRGAPGPRRRA